MNRDTIKELIESHKYFVNEILIFLCIPDTVELWFDFDFVVGSGGYVGEVEGDVFFIAEFPHQGGERNRREEVVWLVFFTFSSSNGIHLLYVYKILTSNLWIFGDGASFPSAQQVENNLGGNFWL